MVENFVKSWWLLALCGVLDALYCALSFFAQSTDGGVVLRELAYRDTVVQLGMLALAAGACTIAAGIMTSGIGKSWLLVLNGLACSVLGLIVTFWTGRLAFRTVALVMIVMALSAGIYELANARTLRGRVAGRWLLNALGIASIGFAVAFLALAFKWINLEPGSPAQSLFWLGAYFGCSAIGMLRLALRSQTFGLSGRRPAARLWNAGT